MPISPLRFIAIAAALAVVDGAQVRVADLALAARLDVRLLDAPRRRAADVEGPHRELRARLADRLRGDHADRLAEVHELAARQIAPVALARRRRAASRR